MTSYILILFLSTSPASRAGASGINVEFNSYQTCQVAGQALAKNASERNNYVLTWGCFKK